MSQQRLVVGRQFQAQDRLDRRPVAVPVDRLGRRRNQTEELVDAHVARFLPSRGNLSKAAASRAAWANAARRARVTVEVGEGLQAQVVGHRGPGDHGHLAPAGPAASRAAACAAPAPPSASQRRVCAAIGRPATCPGGPPRSAPGRPRCGPTRRPRRSSSRSSRTSVTRAGHAEHQPSRYRVSRSPRWCTPAPPRAARRGRRSGSR